jgi:tetratricopeptide (TPR) repeat protein
MSFSDALPSDTAESGAFALLASCPHPDSFAPDLLRELRSAVDDFRTQVGCSRSDSLAAVAKAFKSAGAALDRAAPAPGQHEFRIGERVMLQDLRQRADLNGCVAVVKTEIDAMEGDGRVTVEVSVGNGRQREMLRVKPVNMRLEWHVAADAHAASVGCKVLVLSLVSEARGCVCQVVDFDAQDRTVTVHAAASESGPAADVTARVSVVCDVVPASYIPIAKEAHASAMKVVRQAVGASASHAVTAVLHAVRSCAKFHLRCNRAEEAARICITVLGMLHTGGRSALSQSDLCIRHGWTGSFLLVCGNDIGQELLSRGCFSAAFSNLMQCKVTMATLVGQESAEVASVIDQLAELHEKQDQPADAEVKYKEALRIKELRLGHESLDVAATLNNLANFYKKQDRFVDAESIYKEALRINKLKLGHESMDVAATLSNLANLFERQNQLAEAEMTYKEALRIRELKLGHETPEVALSICNIAGLLSKQQDRMDEAETMYKEALRILVLKLGHESLGVADTIHNLAWLHEKQDRMAEAEAMYQEALRLKLPKLGHESLDIAKLMSNLAAFHWRQNQLDDAVAMYKKALRIEELKLGHESLNVATTLFNLAGLHWKQDRLADAEAMYKEALCIRELTLGHESLDVVTTRNDLSGLLIKQHRLADAEAMYKETLRIKELKLGHESLDVAKTLNDLAALHEDQDRLADAEAMYKEALRIRELTLEHESMDVAGMLNNLAALHDK